MSGGLPNDLANTKAALEPYRAELVAVAVESTFNWYWLVDGLMEAGYAVRLVNTAAVRQYEGLKHTDDEHDAFWLAHLMRLGILPTGYICPKIGPGREVRDSRRRDVIGLTLSNTALSANWVADIKWRELRGA